MGFTIPCLIHKNTKKLRKKLEELGYNYSHTNIFGILQYPCLYTYWHPNLGGLYNGIMGYIPTCIKCGTNESLFLAIAALRDDTDKNQFFVLDANMGSFNDPSSIIPKGSLVKCLTDKWNLPKSDIDSTGIPAHKASVNELIEYFKGKEES